MYTLKPKYRRADSFGFGRMLPVNTLLNTIYLTQMSC